MVKKLLIILALVVVGTAPTVYYFWRQATALPSWYQERGANKNLKDSLPAGRELQEIETFSRDSDGENSSSSSNVQLEGEELTELITSDIASKNGGEQFLQSTKAIHSEIKGDQLEVGAVFNLSQLSETEPQGRKALDKILQKMPQLQDRDVYLSVAGKPEVRGGKITFDENSKIKLGNLSFTVSQIASQFNLPPEKVRDLLTLEVPQMEVQDIQLDRGKINLEVNQDNLSSP